jgi:hypothetical protein
MSKLALALLVVVSAVAHASLARADGTITGLTPSVPAIKTCAVETITVHGTGECIYTVYWGDNNRVILLRPLPFPHEFSHAYSQQGIYMVRAEGDVNFCPGGASATVSVIGPQIASMFLFSQVTPGGTVLLTGKSFGDLPAQIWLHLTDIDDHPMDVPLDYISSTDTSAAGKIPWSVTRVRDQRATLTVVAKCGAVSDALHVNFTAAVDVADLADHTDRLDCSISTGAGVSDECLHWGGSSWPAECGSWPGSGGTLMDPGLGGYHASGWGFHGNGGTDQFFVTTPLQNGWVLNSASANWSEKVGDVSTASEDANTTSAPGTPSPNLGVDWYVGNCGMILYYGNMIITGPVGVPF